VTLREQMRSREGAAETERQLARGMRVWAVERRGSCQPRGCATAMVFGRNRSDALRRAGARLGEEVADDVTDARPFEQGPDEVGVWPF
jgi:hypothetical protein